jgi:hypothetical protein
MRLHPLSWLGDTLCVPGELTVVPNGTLCEKAETAAAAHENTAAAENAAADETEMRCD